MNKKIHAGVAAALAASAAAAAAAGAVVLYLHFYSGMIGDLPQRARQYEYIESIDEIVRANYFGDVDSKRLNDSIAEGYMKGIGDEYSFYIKPEQYKYYEELMNGKTGDKEQSCFYSLNGNIGYIRLASVSSTTPRQFSEAVGDLQKTAAGIILDLRNCVSFNLDAAAEIIDMIVPLGSEGTKAIYTEKNAAGDILKVYPSDSSALSLQFAVLINDRTECAAELIACDLRDFGKAVLFGETTAGHGKMQQLFKLSGGGGILLSVAEIYPYTGGSFSGCGVTPDTAVPLSEEDKNNIGSAPLSEDAQYQQAFSYLSGKALVY